MTQVEILPKLRLGNFVQNDNSYEPVVNAIASPRFVALRIPSRILLRLVLGSLLLTTLAYQVALPDTIDVGSGADTPLIQGFSFRENIPGADVRWSGERAEIRFAGIGAQDGVLKLRLAAPRPWATPRVQILANGLELTRNVSAGDLQELVFPIRRDVIGVGGDLYITLVSDTFTQPPDTRELGVLVDYARFESAGAPVIPSPHVLLSLAALTLLAYAVGRVWTGSARLAVGASVLVILLATGGMALARVETAWLVAPVFWLGLVLFLGSVAVAVDLQALSHLLNAPVLRSRTLRLMFVVMVVAFAVRMIFAVTPGYIVDVQDYLVWSYKMVTHGLGSMYASLDGLWISDQPPGLNYVVYLGGWVYNAFFAPDFLYPGVSGDPALRAVTTNPALLADPAHRTLLRIPMLLADLVTGALIFTAARKNLSERAAWLVALAYWFNPAVLWNGAYWGQTDAIHSLLVLAALLALTVKRVGFAFFLVGIAAVTKPQALIFGPLLLLAAWRAAAWRGVARAVIAGALGVAVILLPIMLAGGTQGMLDFFLSAVGHHPILSVNAHNIWWIAFGGNIDIEDTLPVLAGAPLSYRTLSLILFGISYAAVLVKGWRAEVDEFFELGAYAAFAFFMLPTEIHENYGYALLPMLAVAVTRDRKLIFFYIAITVTMVANYALFDPPTYERLGLSNPDLELWLPRMANAIANAILFALWTVYLFARRWITFGDSRQPATEPVAASSLLQVKDSNAD